VLRSSSFGLWLGELGLGGVRELSVVLFMCVSVSLTYGEA